MSISWLVLISAEVYVFYNMWMLSVSLLPNLDRYPGKEWMANIFGWIVTLRHFFLILYNSQRKKKTNKQTNKEKQHKRYEDFILNGNIALAAKWFLQCARSSVYKTRKPNVQKERRRKKINSQICWRYTSKFIQ